MKLCSFARIILVFFSVAHGFPTSFHVSYRNQDQVKLPLIRFVQVGAEDQVVENEGASPPLASENALATRSTAGPSEMLEVGSFVRRRVVPHVYLSFAFVVKALCMMSNVVFQVAPIPQIRQFDKQQDTGESDAAPFMCILYGGCQWCFYGLFAFVVTHKSGFLVLVYSNIVGALLGFYYVFGFQRNCQDCHSLRKLRAYEMIAGFLATIQLLAMTMMQREQSLFFCGLVSSLCSIVASTSLLSTLPVIMRTGCSASINLPLLTVGLGCSGLWIVCGFILWDPWIMVPNVLGLLIQSFTFSLVLIYPRSPKQLADQEDKHIDEAESESCTIEHIRARVRNVATWHSGSTASTSAVANAWSPAKYGAVQVMGETGCTC